MVTTVDGAGGGGRGGGGRGGGGRGGAGLGGGRSLGGDGRWLREPRPLPVKCARVPENTTGRDALIINSCRSLIRTWYYYY